jgi:mannan endo-1,4-beta-mannosidase
MSYTQLSIFGRQCLMALLVCCASACSKAPAPASVAPALPAASVVQQTQPGLNDPQASAETRALYRNLIKLSGKHILFGHQDSLAYGVHWEGDLDRSDVRDVTGANPAVYGWELGGLELGQAQNLDGVNFQQMQAWIKAGYKRGAVITLSWHMYSPVTGANSWDKASVVQDIIPGGSHHEQFKAYLDSFVTFNEGLAEQDASGKKTYVPIIFRPWHEHNGDWFWWGKGSASEQDYIALYRFTVEYLRDQKGLHNLIYAHSPDRSRLDLADFSASYLYAYPGDSYVDLLGLDNYWDLGHSANTASVEQQQAAFMGSAKQLVLLAQAKHKVAALTEMGNNQLAQADFWTERVLAPLLRDPDAQQIAYFLVWRNANREREKSEHFYVPYPGQASAEDFKTFYQSSEVLFENELPPLYQ